MSIVPSSSRRRETAIQTAKRRIQRLEIETHRIKAELARLEADNEDDIADELTREFRQGEQTAFRLAERRLDGGTRGVLPTDRKRPQTTRRVDPGNGRQATKAAPAPSPIKISATESAGKSKRPRNASRAALRFWTKPAWMLSLGVHAALIAVFGLATYATLSHNDFLLLASPSEFADETLDQISEVVIEPVETEEFEMHEAVADQPFEPSESLFDSLAPVTDPGTLGPAGEIGLSDLMPSDLGTLMSGGGEGEPGGGPTGSASFFGAKSQADRVVFVIDNSSSMKGGRLEAAVDELVRSVEAMTPRQAFYVIFVSDQPYPMYYPEPASALLPATAPHKKRLREWLGGLRLAGGKNRQIIAAMDLAAALRPETVFFLWDGRIDHAGVRRDVMLHLTRPQPWEFTIHTLGMGVNEPEHERNLAAVAQAHGGTYLRVDTATRSTR
jgi:hypothetical protein